MLTVSNGELIHSLGSVILPSYLENKEYLLKCYIFEGNLGHTLLGRTGIEVIWPTWRQLFTNKGSNSVLTVTDSELIDIKLIY